MTSLQYPGVGVGKYTHSVYSEKLLIGHRWYDANGIDPRFEFGFGLSYFNFEFSTLLISSSTGSAKDDIVAMISFAVSNIGRTNGSNECAVNGTEVAQMYLQFPGGSGEPLRQLKGFKK